MKKLLSLILIFFTLWSFSVNAQMCPPKAGTDLIVNGDFEAGPTGFTNDFTPCPGGCPGDLPGDHYVIGTNPASYNSQGYFATMQDHTPGAGKNNMLIFDFNNNSTNSAVYRTTVTAKAGKTYFFSAWFANIALKNVTVCPTCPGGSYITNSPILKFVINGVDQGVVNIDSLSNNWNQFFASYSNNTAFDQTFEIEIINLRGGNSSNDLALDDISFTDGCDKIKNLSTLGQSSALPDTIYNCNVAFPYTLNPGLPPAYGYAWKKVSATTLSTSSTYSEDPTPAAAPADGTKLYLCYEYIAGCPRTDSVIFKNTPIKLELGSDKEMCAPINYKITSGISVPPADIKWYKDNVLIATATGSDYTATDIGTYKATVDRPGCGSATDALTISSPVSTISGTGTYCEDDDKAVFTTTATMAKWYTQPTGGTPLNPTNTDNTINLAYSATNTTTPGCKSGLYVEDVSSYPGAAMTAAPCSPGSFSASNNSGYVQVEINQEVELNSIDFYQRPDYGTTGNFTFNIYQNDPTGGPYVSDGNKEGPATTLPVVYTKTVTGLTAAAQTLQTMPVSVTLEPGKYWFQLTSNVSFALFGCNPAMTAGTGHWSSPITDNTGKGVMNVISAIHNGAYASAGALFNMKFQVGSNNTCSRLFICASEDCVAPVDFLTFDVKKVSNGNILLWKTASETNSSHFNLQRSIDGVNFEIVGRVPAAGNSSTILSYSYIDGKPSSNYETVYYRIQEVDLDGAVTYSNLKSVSDKSSEFISVFPIPVKQGQNLTLEYFSEENSDLNIALFNNLGAFVLNKEFKVEKGYNTIEISTNDLTTGFYLLKSDSFTTKVFVE
jgi:hypothetical protein